MLVEISRIKVGDCTNEASGWPFSLLVGPGNEAIQNWNRKSTFILPERTFRRDNFLSLLDSSSFGKLWIAKLLRRFQSVHVARFLSNFHYRTWPRANATTTIDCFSWWQRKLWESVTGCALSCARMIGKNNVDGHRDSKKQLWFDRRARRTRLAIVFYFTPIIVSSNFTRGFDFHFHFHPSLFLVIQFVNSISSWKVYVCEHVLSLIHSFSGRNLPTI